MTLENLVNRVMGDCGPDATTIDDADTDTGASRRDATDPGAAWVHDPGELLNNPTGWREVVAS
jgi:hypothetical protein